MTLHDPRGPAPRHFAVTRTVIIRFLKHLAAAALVSVLIWSCSSTQKSASIQEFVVEYYTMGGFAGTSEGFTLTSDGLVRFWRGRTPELRSILDSLQLGTEALGRIAEALRQKDLYTIRPGVAENLTNVVSVRSGTGSNVIMFSPLSPPEGETPSLKLLLTELQKIHRPNH